MTFSERLTSLRKERGFTQKQVAQSCGLSTYGYQRYEYGEREPVVSVAVTLSEYFNVSIDYLVGRTDKPEVNR